MLALLTSQALPWHSGSPGNSAPPAVPSPQQAHASPPTKAAPTSCSACCCYGVTRAGFNPHRPFLPAAVLWVCLRRSSAPNLCHIVCCLTHEHSSSHLRGCFAHRSFQNLGGPSGCAGSLQLLRVGFNGFACDRLCPAALPADAQTPAGEFTGGGPAAGFVFDQPVSASGR